MIKPRFTRRYIRLVLFVLVGTVACYLVSWTIFAQRRPVPKMLEPAVAGRLSAPTADGDLDTTFHDPGSTKSPNGVDRQNMGATTADSDSAAGIGIQKLAANAGKIVLGGDNTPASSIRNLALTRYNSSGTLDSGFGTSGKTVTVIGGTPARSATTTNSGSQMLAIDPTDDGIVLVSELTDATNTNVTCNPSGFTHGSQWLITRYTANGTLDAAFNAAGTGFNPGGTGSAGHLILDLSSGCRNFPTGVVVRADGKIVVVGFSQNQAGTFQNAIALITKAGALDSANFPSGGVVKNAFAGEIWAVALDPTGKYVVAGDNPPGNSSDFLAARFNTNGTLDTTFNPGGSTPGVNTTNIGGQDTARAVVVRPSDGRVLIAGDSGLSNFAMVRYSNSGTLDTGFGASGITTTSIGSGLRQVNSINLMTDNRIILTGKTSATTPGALTTTGIAIARYSAGGILDTTFGTSGKVVTQLGTDPSNSQDLGEGPTTGTIQSDNKILVAGQIFNLFGGGFTSDLDFFVARFQNTGIVTAAKVSVSGRVLGSDSSGLRGATVSMRDSQGNVRTAITSAFGYYVFDGVDTGSYVVGVGSRRYAYSSRLINISDQIADLDFQPLQ